MSAAVQSYLPPELLIGGAVKRFEVFVISGRERVCVTPIGAEDAGGAAARGLELVSAQKWWTGGPVVFVRVRKIR